MKNQEIREEIFKKGLKHYEIAEACGVSSYTFSHWLQRELPTPKKQEIMRIISELTEERADEKR